MTTKTFLALAALVAVGVPAISFAQTYHYVNLEGEVEAVEADSAAQALIAPANIHPNSGVAIDMGIIEEGMEVNTIGGTGGANQFAYVNTAGEVAAITAPNPDVALASAVNIHPQSGVVIVIDGSVLEVDEVESAK